MPSFTPKVSNYFIKIAQHHSSMVSTDINFVPEKNRPS